MALGSCAVNALSWLIPVWSTTSDANGNHLKILAILGIFASPPFPSIRNTLFRSFLGGWQEKTDVTEHPEAFDHVGLLVNGPPGMAELPFI
jgi:hypothetical protein